MRKTLPIVLTIRSTLTRDGEKELVEESARGMLRLEEGIARLSYTQEADGTKTTTTLTHTQDLVTLTRSGGIRSYTEFCVGTPYTSSYEIPPYTFDLQVTTHRIAGSFSVFGGTLSLVYDSVLGGEVTHVVFTLEGRVPR